MSKTTLHCYNCNQPLVEVDEDDYDTIRKYKNEYGKPECFGCRKRRHKAYDDYVDPLRAYH